MHNDVCFAQLEIQVGHKLLQSRVKTLEKAQQIFEDKTAEQKPVAIAKFSGLARDV